MHNQYILIDDERVLNKIEVLLGFDGMNQAFIDRRLLIEYLGTPNHKSIKMKKISDYCNVVSELRSFLFSELPQNAKTSDFDKYIDDFLFLLRIDKHEASLCLNKFIDVVLANISTLYYENCFKRLTCVMYVIYKAQFGSDAAKKLFSDYTFTNNTKALKEEDKNYLINIFICENDFDGLKEIIYSYFEQDESRKTQELPTEESANKMYAKLWSILKKYTYRAEEGISKYENVYGFLNKINFSNTGDVLKKTVTGFSDYMERWLFQYALFSGRREDILLKKDMLNSLASDDTYSDYLYYYAQFSKIESRKEKTNNRDDYLKDAFDYIRKAETAKKANPKQTMVDLTSILQEKSAIIAETEDYATAYDNMLSVVINLNERPKSIDTSVNTSYYHYLIWISAQYLRIKSREGNILKHNVIEYLDKYVNKNLFYLKEFEPIAVFAENNLLMMNYPDVKDDIYSNLLIMMGCADLIIQKSRIWDVSKYNVLYYTRAENLRFLLEDEKDEVKYRLPIFHANHMNDPEEGKILKKLFADFIPRSVSEKDNTSQREKYNENYVFLKSFFISDKANFNEFLPMWVQYGDDAKGVCVLLNESTFDDAELVKINYLNDDGKCVNNDEIDELINDYKNAYKEILKFCDNDLESYPYGMKKEFMDEINDLLEYINARIMYLFKHESYEHENEARVIIARKSSDLDDVKTIPGAVPKLFIHSKTQTYIDEIILGSKMEVPDDLVPFIHYHGRKMWANNNNRRQITVSNSSIQYR